MLQKTGNVVLEIFQENTGSLHRFIKLYDHRGKIHAVLKKLRLPQFQTEICNFVVIGRWKSQLLCQPGSDFLRMDRFATMGAELLFLTNASGGINPSFSAGDLMLLTDHISLFAPNPLIGQNFDELGVRFPDMTQVYDRDLQKILKKTAAEQKIALQEGVYAQLTGPSYETPAEVELLRRLGADAVGMSTAVEAVAANHMGMRICGISCISNLAAGMTKQPLSHEEVQAAADSAAPKFQKLVTESIQAFYRE